MTNGEGWRFCTTVTHPAAKAGRGDTHVLEQHTETLEYRTRPISEVAGFGDVAVKIGQGKIHLPAGDTDVLEREVRNWKRERASKETPPDAEAKIRDIDTDKDDD